MTTNWKRTETADGAGAEALGVFARACAAPERRLVRTLRWKRDAVCRDAAADEELRDAEPGNVSGAGADAPGSSLTRTIFFTSRIQTQPSTRKETPNTTQKKKGKQTRTSNNLARKPETLA